MDLINNLIYTALNPVPIPLNYYPALGLSQYPILGAPPSSSSYTIAEIESFCAYEDTEYIEKSIQKHWADMVLGRSYINPNTFNIYTNFTTNPLGIVGPPYKLLPPYHLIYAYLVENTRIAQIFEKVIYLYMHDEKLNKAATSNNKLAFQWLMNTESLFFKNLPNHFDRNVTSLLRISGESTHRNAYYRMFGMDLAFMETTFGGQANYYKSEFNNQGFIPLFERFLIEIWHAYTNASNTSGANNTDIFSITDAAEKIQEMLMSRRTTDSNMDNYRFFNLSKEEFSSVVMMSWFFEAISYDAHPIIQFLRCNGNTPGERLINLGNKVGIPAHSKSDILLTLAPPMNTLLRRIEMGDYNISADVKDIIRAEADSLPSDNAKRMALSDLLLIINNWEKATGHKIKYPAASLNGTLKVEQKQIRLNTVMN